MRWTVPLIVLAIGAAWMAVALRDKPMDVDGYLYRGWTRVPSHHRIDPISGALITSDRNTSRTTTDATGHFHLQTSYSGRDELIVLRVRSGDVVRCQSIHGFPHLRMDLILSTLPPCSAEVPAAPRGR